MSALTIIAEAVNDRLADLRESTNTFSAEHSELLKRYGRLSNAHALLTSAVERARKLLERVEETEREGELPVAWFGELTENLRSTLDCCDKLQ